MSLRAQHYPVQAQSGCNPRSGLSTKLLMCGVTCLLRVDLLMGEGREGSGRNKKREEKMQEL